MPNRVLIIVLFALACAGLSRLGFWQLDRAEVKRVRYQAYISAHEARPVVFDTLSAADPTETYRWRKTRLHGHYLDHQVLLDNRHHAGRSGYEVLTPFVTSGQRTLLVNRGFTPLEGSREQLPQVMVGSDEITVDGYLGDAPVVGLVLNQAALTAEQLSPRLLRVQRVDFDGLAALLDVPLWPAVLYLNADSPGALLIDWPLPGDGSSRHTAYAVQWFAMAAVLAFIGLFNFRRRGKNRQ